MLPVSNTSNYIGTLFAADLDGDGDMDILGAEGDRVSWYALFVVIYS